MEEILRNKKGQSGAVMSVLVGFTIIATIMILMVLLIYTFGTVGIGLESTAESQTSVNETGFYINQSGFQLANGISGAPRTFTIDYVINDSGLVIESANWTISTNGLVTNATSALFSEAAYDLNITYSYVNDSAEITATRDAQTNTSRAIPIVGTLFIILAVGALITILLISFIGRRRS